VTTRSPAPVPFRRWVQRRRAVLRALGLAWVLATRAGAGRVCVAPGGAAGIDAEVVVVVEL